jgi:hypothetical protein
MKHGKRIARIKSDLIKLQSELGQPRHEKALFKLVRAWQFVVDGEESLEEVHPEFLEDEDWK